MPTVKISAKAREHKTGFEGYSGPEPDRPGAYRGVVKRIRWREYSTGSQGFVVLVELQAAADTPDKAKYDGAPYWTNVVAVPAPGASMKDGSIRSVENFLAALSLPDDPAIAYDDGDTKRGVELTKLGGKSVANLYETPVVLDLGTSSREGGSLLEVNNLRPSGEKRSSGAPLAQDNWVEPEADEEAEEEPWDRTTREAELKAMRLPALRRFAEDDYDLTTTGLSKVELITLVLDHEEGGDDEPPMATAPDAEPEEDEEDDEDVEVEVEEEDEEEDDSEAYDQRAAELQTFDRAALKAALKGASPDQKVFKTTTDDQIREWILAAEFQVEDEAEESGTPPF